MTIWIAVSGQDFICSQVLHLSLLMTEIVEKQDSQIFWNIFRGPENDKSHLILLAEVIIKRYLSLSK